jgi:hypothetical protein
MKKGRHRRYEEARALKRSQDKDDIESLIDRLDEDPFNLPVTPEAKTEYDFRGCLSLNVPHSVAGVNQLAESARRPFLASFLVVVSFCSATYTGERPK